MLQQRILSIPKRGGEGEQRQPLYEQGPRPPRSDGNDLGLNFARDLAQVKK